MNRPIYETKEHLAQEEPLIAVVCAEWKCKSHKLPIKYKVDYALTRNNYVCAWCEVKVRNKRSDSYPTLFLSLDKYQAMIDLHRVTKIPCYFVNEFNDGVFWWKVESFPSNITITGRKDRGDKQDVEPAVEIPMESFKRIGEAT